MRPAFRNLLASLILAPGILLLFSWFRRFMHAEAQVYGLAEFLLWSAATAVAVAYIVTLYLDFHRKA